MRMAKLTLHEPVCRTILRDDKPRFHCVYSKECVKLHEIELKYFYNCFICFNSLIKIISNKSNLHNSLSTKYPDFYFSNLQGFSRVQHDQ